MDEPISFQELREKISEHLEIALGIEDFDITFAKLETKIDKIGSPEQKVWRVNASFKKPSEIIMSTVLFEIDATDGSILKFEKDKYWNY